MYGQVQTHLLMVNLKLGLIFTHVNPIILKKKKSAEKTSKPKVWNIVDPGK